MTKLFRNSFFVLLQSVTILPSNQHENPGLWTNTNKLGPFDINDKGVLSIVPVEYEYNYGIGKTVYESVTITSMDNRSLYYKRLQSHYIYETESPIKRTFELPIYDYLDPTGRKLIFSIRNPETHALLYDQVVLNIFPINCVTFNPFETNNKIYESKPIVSLLKYGVPTHYHARYDFSGLADTFDGDDNRHLHYPICSFKYHYEKEQFSYKEAYIKFFDQKNLFPYYTTSADGYKHIPVRLVYDDYSGSIEVRIKHEFYLKVDTMQISDIYRKGFEMTGFFTFPYNFDYYANQYNFEMVMVDLGVDKLDVVYPISLGNSKGYFGLCKNSEYCVTGGVVE